MFSEVITLDIETDTTGGHGLDPTHAAITEIAVALGPQGREVVCTGAEDDILACTAAIIADAPVGSVLVTWNGAAFDLPFIDHRISRNRDLCARIGPHRPVRHLPLSVERKYPPIEGDTEELRAWTWAGLPHLDIAYGFRSFAEERGIRWSLKSVARAHGIEVIELDRTRMHEYSPAEREEYARSDVRATRALALILLGDTTGG